VSLLVSNFFSFCALPGNRLNPLFRSPLLFSFLAFSCLGCLAGKLDTSACIHDISYIWRGYARNPGFAAIPHHGIQVLCSLVTATWYSCKHRFLHRKYTYIFSSCLPLWRKCWSSCLFLLVFLGPRSPLGGQRVEPRWVLPASSPNPSYSTPPSVAWTGLHCWEIRPIFKDPLLVL